MNANILRLAIQGMVEPTVEHIATLISYLPEEQQENALMIFAGIEHKSIPATSNVDNNATLISYNPLTGNVQYEYDRPEQKYYKHDYPSKQDAQSAIHNGTFVEGTKYEHYLHNNNIVKDKSNCSLTRWLK